MLFVMSKGYFLIRILSYFLGESYESEVMSLNRGDICSSSSGSLRTFLGVFISNLLGVLGAFILSWTLLDLDGLYTDLEYLLSSYAFLT